MSQTIIIMHRWNNSFMQFQNVIDHAANRVIYFVNPDGKKGIESYIDQASRVFEFTTMTDIEELRAACREVIDQYGGIDRLIAMSELDLTPAAILRTEFGIVGTQEHQVKMYRDKVEMKKRMERDGIRAPKFIDCETPDDVIAFSKEIGFPLILKPKSGASSHGVHQINTEAELHAVLPKIDFSDYECEEFVAGPIFHTDGVTHNGEIVFLSVSRYFNDCLGFLSGNPVGSIIEDDPAIREQLGEFTKRVLKSLELENSAFHLEIIMKNGNEPVFLEIGARLSGGEFAFQTQDVYGVHIGEEWLKIELGLFDGIKVEQRHPCGGYVLIPEPRDTPVEVIRNKSLINEVDGMIKEILAQPGDVLDGNGGYVKISGRFMFRGESRAQIEDAFRKTIDLFDMEYKPLSSVKA
ncbi:ATP-grasp domain-containing protein [Tumebacillus sp. DT12]|uniref:ATP-grasp domain-containing protein n=1 Tax=Tumebacillus lacus TaxID=2995335 RepID=A0ABT3WXJ8_9BACL|nr:ATP-grasp domain-containing protein [Tumebacillus lacus]MCX7569399.1 ATP-grasp domain-containing protein [Tumebacillus lacus]